MSVWAAADMLISEILMRSSGLPRTAFFQNMRPRPPGQHLPAEVHGPEVALLTRSVEIPWTGLEAGGATVQKLLPGWPGTIFLNTGVVFCTIYCVFERAPQPHRTFYGTLYKIKE